MTTQRPLDEIVKAQNEENKIHQENEKKEKEAQDKEGKESKEDDEPSGVKKEVKETPKELKVKADPSDVSNDERKRNVNKKVKTPKWLTETLMGFNSVIWKYKKDKGLSLNSELEKVVAPESLKELERDLKAMHKIKEMVFKGTKTSVE